MCKHEEKTPRVGVSVIIVRDGKVLMGKRKGSHGSGTWSFPGGHLEYNEHLFVCAAREVFEETGMSLVKGMQGPFTSDHFKEEDLHYITLYIEAEAVGEPELREPDKFEKWEWFPTDSLPSPLFLCVQNLLTTNGGYRFRELSRGEV
jgi:8-oxo-dGTP diphosphatase